MRPPSRALALALFLALALLSGPAAAQEPEVEPDTEQSSEPDATGEAGEVGPPAPPAEAPPPIYEEQLLRLSEILGSLSFLRQLCGATDSAVWRDEMSALLAAEQPGPQRRARLIGRFNHGFETFNAVYRTCTPSARLSISRYLGEGQTLSNNVRSRYSQ
ncbi:MAG: TIGR02301 family protein [Pseudomonadota bacterium]|nr:TIGR02301 family protein [Pseudomonadota bacterium]